MTMNAEEFPRNPRNPPPRGEESSERERAVAEALAAYLDRVSREETVDIDTFCKIRPGLENELRPLLESLNEMDGPPFSESSAPESEGGEELPERLSGHKILGEIGTGGMGRVLLGSDERLNRKVAIKILGGRYRTEESVKARFMHEARALAQISHPNIVHIFSLGPPDELPHFVMELVEGTSRRDRKSTRLNSSHGSISYAVLCLKKKNRNNDQRTGKDQRNPRQRAGVVAEDEVKDAVGIDERRRDMVYDMAETESITSERCVERT